MATNNENAINLIVSQEAVNQLNVAIGLVDTLDKLILKTATDSANISAKLASIKTPSGLAGNSVDNATVTAQLQSQATQIKALEASILKLNDAKKKLNQTSVQEQVNQRILLQNATLEAKAVSTMAGAYVNLDNEHKKALRSAQNMGAQYGITSEQFKKASDKANELDKKLKEIDANVGRHQRNVGNYASGWNALGNSINQLTREAPAFANSLNTGFMAISNNIPALTDAIKGLRAENVRLRAEGQPTVSVFKQLASSIFSWQTAISLGVTLLTVYGGEIVTWIQKMASGKKSIDAMAEAQILLNNAQEEGLKNSTEEITHLEVLRRKAEDVNSNMTERKEAVKEMQDLYPSYLGNMTEEQILAGNTGDAYKQLRTDILAVSEARAIEAEMVKLATEKLKIEKALREGESFASKAFNADLKGQLMDIGAGGLGNNAEKRGREKFEKARNKELEAIAKEREILMAKLLAIDSGSLSQTTGKDTKLDDKKAKTPKKLVGVDDTTFELEKQRLERVIAVNEEIVKNEELTDQKRINALELSAKTQEELTNKTRDNQIKQAEETFKKEFAEGNKTKEGLIQLRVNFEAEKIRIAEDASNKIVDIEKKTADEIKKINAFDASLYTDEIKRRLNAIEIANNELILAEEKRFEAELAIGYKNNKTKQKQAEAHEKELFEIKKKGLIETAKLQQEQLQLELDAYISFANSDGTVTQKESDMILKIRKDLSDATVALYKAQNSEFKASEKGKPKEVELNAKEILQISEKMLGDLSDLSNAFTERRIQGLEAQIEASNAYYDNQIEQETAGEKKKKELQKEKEKAEAELQKRIGKEKEKQAKIDKAVAIAQIGIQTALAIIKATPNIPLMVLSAVTGAIATATAIATPIPKYKDGRQGGKAEFAIVGDGGTHEVITDNQGNNPILTPRKSTLTHLNRGDIVHKSMEDYSVFKIAKSKELQMFGRQKDNNDLLYEMQLTRKVIEKQKLNVNVQSKPVDINYALWKNAQIHW
jgi:hypothetical protein